jgi:hypothetical protein
VTKWEEPRAQTEHRVYGALTVLARYTSNFISLLLFLTQCYGMMYPLVQRDTNENVFLQIAGRK